MTEQGLLFRRQDKDDGRSRAADPETRCHSIGPGLRAIKRGNGHGRTSVKSSFVNGRDAASATADAIVRRGAW